MRVKSICGVILLSDDPRRLADFYGQVLGCAFYREDHGDLAEHFGVDIGLIHFAIHRPSDFRRVTPAGSSAVTAFDVPSLREAMAILETLGAKQVQPPHDEGFGPVASYFDPDGNQFELVELRYEFAKSGP